MLNYIQGVCVFELFMGGDVLRRPYRGVFATARGRCIRKQYFRFNVFAQFRRKRGQWWLIGRFCVGIPLNLDRYSDCVVEHLVDVEHCSQIVDKHLAFHYFRFVNVDFT